MSKRDCWWTHALECLSSDRCQAIQMLTRQFAMRIMMHAQMTCIRAMQNTNRCICEQQTRRNVNVSPCRYKKKTFQAIGQPPIGSITNCKRLFSPAP